MKLLLFYMLYKNIQNCGKVDMFRLLFIMQYYQVSLTFILHYQSNPKHTTKVIRNYLQQPEEQGIQEQMVCPPQSHDSNIMESVWNYMRRQKTLTQPRSTEELWRVLQGACNNQPAKYVEKVCRG